MSKPSWTEAPSALQRRALGWIEAGPHENSPMVNYRTGAGLLVAADFDPPAPKTPALDGLRALESRHANPEALADYRRRNAIALAEEKAAVLWFTDGLTAWRARRPQREIEAEQRAEREQAAQREALERRATEILAEAERADHEKRHKAAIKQAEKELAP